MAQIDTDLYKAIADAYATINTSLATVSADARTALNAIVDVDTTTYPDPSANADAALEIELALLNPFNAAYVSAQTIETNVGAIIDAVRAVNNFVINNISGTDTATAKMDGWINGSMTPTWAACPIGWANLCDSAGYDTTNWSTA